MGTSKNLESDLKIYTVHYHTNWRDEKHKYRTHDHIILNFQILSYSGEEAIEALIEEYPSHNPSLFEVVGVTEIKSGSLINIVDESYDE